MAVRPLERRPTCPGVFTVYIEKRDDRLRRNLTPAQQQCHTLTVRTRTGYAWSQLPDDLQRLGARKVHLSMLRMSTLDRLWPDTHSVRELQLFNFNNLVQITKLPAGLTKLVINNCRQLQTLPYLADATTLTHLELYCVATWPRVLPPMLVNLAVYFSEQPRADEYTDLCSAIVSASTLTSLDMRFERHMLLDVPDVSALPQLASLTVGVGNTVPDHVFRCWQLRHLGVAGDTYIRIPDTFAQLRHLTSVTISRYAPAQAPAPSMPASLVEHQMLHRDVTLYGIAANDAAGRSIYAAVSARRRCYQSHAALVLCSARRRRRLPPELHNMIREQWLVEVIADLEFD
jgi:hypothetical protein